MKTIIILLVFSTFTGGKWVEDSDFMIGGAETDTCREIAKGFRKQLGEMAGFRFESMTCRAIHNEGNTL
jgi:hypothetical protein